MKGLGGCMRVDESEVVMLENGERGGFIYAGESKG